MSIDLFGYSNIGSRAINEDYYCISEGENSCIAVLCDGLGGHDCGEVASKLAAEGLVNGIKQLPSITPDTINGVLSAVNDGLIRQQINDPSCNGMRTTAVGCIVDNNQIQYFNVGDSRFYLFKNGAVKYMSKDHSVSQLSVEMGQMTFSDIRGDADRSKLLRVLGEQSNGDSVGTIYRTVDVQPGDAFLLCSDGFWEYILESEMEVDLAKSHTAEEWVKFMIVRLLLRVDGNNDNFTVIGGIIDGSSDSFGAPALTQEDIDEWSDRNTQIPVTMEKDSIPDMSDLNTTALPDTEGKVRSGGKRRSVSPAAADNTATRASRSSSHGNRHAKKKKPKKFLGIKMSRSNKVIIACIVIGLCVALVGTWLGITFGNKDNSKTDPAATPEITETANPSAGEGASPESSPELQASQSPTATSPSPASASSSPAVTSPSPAASASPSHTPAATEGPKGNPSTAGGTLNKALQTIKSKVLNGLNPKRNKDSKN